MKEENEKYSKQYAFASIYIFPYFFTKQHGYKRHFICENNTLRKHTQIHTYIHKHIKLYWIERKRNKQHQRKIPLKIFIIDEMNTD